MMEKTLFKLIPPLKISNCPINLLDREVADTQDIWAENTGNGQPGWGQLQLLACSHVLIMHGGYDNSRSMIRCQGSYIMGQQLNEGVKRKPKTHGGVGASSLKSMGLFRKNMYGGSFLKSEPASLGWKKFCCVGSPGVAGVWVATENCYREATPGKTQTCWEAWGKKKGNPKK